MSNENELDTTCGVSDEELTYRFREAVRIENEIKKIKHLPIAKYDHIKKQANMQKHGNRKKLLLSLKIRGMNS